MINLFAMAPDDQSIYYLTQIFGYIGTVFPPTTPAPSLLLSVLFKTFNSIVLSIAVLIIVYITVVGVLKTAGEGEFLGKQWNSLWVPIRMVLGIAALVPAPSGYSGLQILMMWVIVQGVGAADTLWTTALTYVNYGGSPYAGTQVDYGATETNLVNLFQGLVCANTTHLAYSNPVSPEENGGYFCQDHPEDLFCKNNNINDLQANSKCAGGECSYQMGPIQPNAGGACGTLTYCDVSTACVISDSLACLGCKAQTEALVGIVGGTLGPLAKMFAETDYQYRVFYNQDQAAPKWMLDYCDSIGLSQVQCCKMPGASPNAALSNCKLNPIALNDADPNNANPSVVGGILWPFAISSSATVSGSTFMEIVLGQYSTAMSGAVASYILQLSSNPNNINDKDNKLTRAREVGWLFAGAYYYYIAKMNDRDLEGANPVFNVSSINIDQGNILYNTRNNFQVAGMFAQDAQDQSANTGGFTVNYGNTKYNYNKLKMGGSELKKLSSSVFSLSNGIMKSFMKTVSGDKSNKLSINSLVRLQNLGAGILLAIQLVAPLLMIQIFGLGLLGGLSGFALGNGFVNPLGPAVITLMMLISPIILAFMLLFLGIGATLAVYTPLIPYIIYTFGAIGWFIAVIEAMVAGPLVALGILSPGGQHEILGKAEPALMLLFSIFMRPALMVFGMMAAMLLSAVVVTMINAGFETVMLQITSTQYLGQTGKKSGGGVDFLELVFFLCAYTMLVVSALNKAFALIHLVPDKVLRWIGSSHHDEFGSPTEALQKAEGGVGGAARQAGGIAQSAGSKGEQTGKAHREREDLRAKKMKEREDGGKTDIKPE